MGKQQILCVNDDHELQRGLEGIIRTMGHNAVRAQSGELASREYRDRKGPMPLAIIADTVGSERGIDIYDRLVEEGYEGMVLAEVVDESSWDPWHDRGVNATDHGFYHPETDLGGMAVKIESLVPEGVHPVGEAVLYADGPGTSYDMVAPMDFRPTGIRIGDNVYDTVNVRLTKDATSGELKVNVGDRQGALIPGAPETTPDLDGFMQAVVKLKALYAKQTKR